MENGEIVKALHELQLTVSTCLTKHGANLDDHCDRLEIIFGKIHRHETTLYGMGEKQGMVSKVNGIEEKEDKRQKTIGALIIAFFIAAADRAYEFFTKS